MARRRSSEKRVLVPDPQYNSELVARVINALMISGKKTTAERIVYGALAEIADKTGKNPLEVLDLAICNMRPKVEVKSRRVGGTTDVLVDVRVISSTARNLRDEIELEFAHVAGPLG
jgi:small subunit ribosomal protein S7